MAGGFADHVQGRDKMRMAWAGGDRHLRVSCRRVELASSPFQTLHLFDTVSDVKAATVLEHGFKCPVRWEGGEDRRETGRLAG